MTVRIREDEAGFCWAPYGSVAIGVHDADGELVCIVGLPAEKRLARIEGGTRDESAAQREQEARHILAGREANVAWARRIVDALNGEGV